MGVKAEVEVAEVGPSNPLAIYWYSAASMKAYAQIDDQVLKTTEYSDVNGFKLFMFEDGSSWQSEEPVLSGDGHTTTTLKRPAMAKAKKASTSSAWKLVHSQIYHQVKKEERKKSERRGLPFDDDGFRAVLRKRLAAAKAKM